MASLVSTYRRRCSLSVSEVARRAGYRNLSKGANRLVAIERGDDAFPDARVLARFARVLGLDGRDIDQALCEQFTELDRPAPPHVTERVMPGVYLSVELPANCTPDRAIELAAAHAAATGRSVCVTLSRVRTIYVEPDGTRSPLSELPRSSSPGLGEVLKLAMRARDT